MTQQQPDLDSILRKVQACIALADHPNTPPEEADAARQRAEAMMFKYRIDEAMASKQADQRAGIMPTWREVRVSPLSNPYSETYRYVAAVCFAHVDAKMVSFTQRDEQTGEYHRVLRTCGYDSDLRYAELLFTSFALAFGSKMEPKVDPTLSDQENAYRMRSAGMEGWRISKALWGRDDKAARSKARKLFAKEAEARGEDPSVLLGQGNSVSVFRASYADGFENEAAIRLRRMRMAHDHNGEMVLASRKTNVEEMFYKEYPNLRPGKPSTANQIGGRDTCEKCKKAKSGYCRDHSYLRPRMSDYRTRPHHAAGYDQGQRAARSVDLASGARGRVEGNDVRAIGNN